MREASTTTSRCNSLCPDDEDREAYEALNATAVYIMFRADSREWSANVG